MTQLKVSCLNNNQERFYTPGTMLKDMISDFEIPGKLPILGAMVNNSLEELNYRIFKPKELRFINATHPDGYKMYTRSLSFVLLKAVKELFPHIQVHIEHAVSKGYYCELVGLDQAIDDELCRKIELKMTALIKADLPIVREEIPTNEAIKRFTECGFNEKAKLFQSRPEVYTSVYYIDDYMDYFYGYLVPTTGCLSAFAVKSYFNGILLMFPKKDNPELLEDFVQQDQMFNIFREYKRWSKILGVSTIGGINKAVKRDKASELIKIAEALMEKKVAKIADKIRLNKEQTKIVLIAGPSSSGKTTFSKRLAVQLKVNRMKPIQLSLDNYFVDREKTPLDENGEYNFEALEAIDIELFNQNLLDLLSGEEIQVPKFSFETGKRYFDGQTLRLKGKNIILIEGIHALNPALTPIIDHAHKFLVYVSALTEVAIDYHNRIPTTDNRLIRRMIRDYRYRNYSALDTLRRWASVRAGEEKYIFPFQENADAMFNSALTFELGVLKPHAEPLLNEVQAIEPEYAEARRLLKFLSYFEPIPEEEIPPTSVLREFLGGSSFKY